MEKAKSNNLKNMSSVDLEARYKDINVRYEEMERERKPLYDDLNDVQIELGRRLLVGRMMNTYNPYHKKNGYLKVKEILSVCPSYDNALSYTVRTVEYLKCDGECVCRDEDVLYRNIESQMSVRVKDPTVLPTGFLSKPREEEIDEKIRKDELLIQTLKLLLMDKDGRDVRRGSTVTFIYGCGHLETGKIKSFDIETKLFTIGYRVDGSEEKTIEITHDKFTLFKY